MPRSRPQLSITLPRNFTFHYVEGEEQPKTPEHHVPLPIPPSKTEGPYRIKRRSRPATTSTLQDNTQTSSISRSDVPIPSIEFPTKSRHLRPLLQQAATEPSELSRASLVAQKHKTLPRTPKPQHSSFLNGNGWASQQDIGESIIRPLSTCSIASNSSDEYGSVTSFPTADGSCTSPESDAPDPFRFASIRRSKGRSLAAFTKGHESNQSRLPGQHRLKWTPDMDRHLWSTFLVYLQDPTVTPFKMLPGVPPPLGVCHRVAREVRKTWKSRQSCVVSSPLHDKTSNALNPRLGSPDTIRAIGSGKYTPCDGPSPRLNAWPKSGSSTRQRLRLLCRRKPIIAPHYQRLLQSRSPSPFSSSSPFHTRSRSRLSEASSPIGLPNPSFSTRDVQLSLTASTSDTMHPDGPLAQLTTNEQPKQEWFNEPPVPFASEIPIPSDTLSEKDGGVQQDLAGSLEPRRLGSPFGFHTWGPSRSKQRLRSSTVRMQSSDVVTIGPGPSLRSSLPVHELLSYPGIHKRRARNQLEEELSPGGSSVQQNLSENLFESLVEGRHRRVRSRGFSLGDVQNQSALGSLFIPPAPADSFMSSDNTTPFEEFQSQPKTPSNPSRHLGSPFHGIAPRPTRRTPRHLATMSLGAYDVSSFSSIGETLGNAVEEDNVSHEHSHLLSSPGP